MAAIWLIWLICLVSLAAMGDIEILKWLIIVTPFCVVASSVATFLASRKLSVSVKIRESGSKRQGIKGEINIENHSVFPIVQLRCKMKLKNLLTGEESDQIANVACPPMKNQKAQMTLRSKHCGNLSILFTKVYAVDFFGLTRFKVDFHSTAAALVAPETFPLGILLTNESLHPEENEEYEPNRGGEDVSEIFRIREYVPGDNIKHIHWKLSSKLSQLIVREPGDPIKASLLIFVDTSIIAEDNERLSPRLDTLIEVAISLGNALIDLGIPFILAWQRPDGTLANKNIKDADNMADALPGLLSARDFKDKETPMLSASLFDKIRVSHMFWISTHAPTVIPEHVIKFKVLRCVATKEQTKKTNGDELVFTPRSYKSVLEHFVL